MKLAAYSRLNDTFETSFEAGNIAAALESCAAIIELIEKGSLPASLLPYHKYELGIMNAVIECDQEAVSELREVIELLESSKRKEHIWLVNESIKALSLIEGHSDSDDDLEDVLWEEEYFGLEQIKTA